jgi:hypothetical protein
MFADPPSAPWITPSGDLMLLNTLEKQAALQPNAIALQGDSRSWSWQQYHDAVKAVVNNYLPSR